MITKIIKKKEKGVYTVYSDNQPPKDMELDGDSVFYGGDMILVEGGDGAMIIDFRTGEETKLDFETRPQRLSLELRLKCGKYYYYTDDEDDYDEVTKVVAYLQSCPEFYLIKDLVVYLIKELINTGNVDEVSENIGELLWMFKNDDDTENDGIVLLVIELGRAILYAKESNLQK